MGLLCFLIECYRSGPTGVVSSVYTLFSKTGSVVSSNLRVTLNSCTLTSAKKNKGMVWNLVFVINKQGTLMNPHTVPTKSLDTKC